MREDGFYWVSYRGRWIVAEWGAGCWMSVEFGARNEYTLSDQELDEIGQKVVRA
jgi:hypothetical protein